MDTLTTIISLIACAFTLAAIIYHFYNFAKCKKNKNEVFQVVKFNEENLIDNKSENIFKFEEIKNRISAVQQINISGSIRLAADLGFDYNTFLAIREEEFTHNIIDDNLGAK